MNIIDIIAVVILALTIFLGYKKGLIGVAFKLLTFIVALILTVCLYNPISTIIINNTNIDESIEQKIEENIGNEDEVKLTGVEYIDGYLQEMKDTSVNAVAKEIAISITKIITAIGLFIVIKLISFLFYKISETLAGLPIIKQFNKAGGIVYGLLEGIIIIYIAIMIATIIAPIINNINIISYISGSIVGKIIL